MKTTQDCYFFDFVFLVKQQVTNEVVGVDTLTQADSAERGRAARVASDRYVRDRENATGLTWQRHAWGPSGSLDAVVDELTRKYGAL